jgi:arylsulfatase
LGRHIFGVRYARTGTVENSHTPLGDTALFIDDVAVAELPAMRTHPGMFALAGGGICIGRNTGSAVSKNYRGQFGFTGGTIARVTVDLSGEPYEDVEATLALAFCKD